jgi:dihydrofolate synthase/folylpolyglutamate synthase
VLQEFLDAKPLFYDEINYDRMPRVYKRIAVHFKLPKIIHIIGTNGKGTTGRFLSTALYREGYHTGHYTSPHIMEFNERIWFNGANVSMELLEATHQDLLAILTEEESESLSYFEYTTLLAMLFFSGKSDFVVLEAGLGGEHDATAVFTNELTLVTPIDRDHESFLGNDIESIAKAKLSAIQKAAVTAKQKYDVVYDICKELQEEKTLQIFQLDELLDEKDREKIAVVVQKEALADYLRENLSLAVAALKYFQIDYIAEDFYDAKLFGRLWVLEKNILVDVGHNTLAAESILRSLKNNKYTLVYNSYKDKNYKEILSILKPLIEKVELIDIYNTRAEQSSFLYKALDELDIQYSKFEKIEEKKKYLVFGSFSVVEAFLKVYRG